MIEGIERNRDEYLTENARLVHHACKRYVNQLQYMGISYDDLFQLGFIGFMKAFDRFDDTYKVKFSTYAIPMILGEIQRFLRDDGIIKTSRAVKSLAKLIKHQDLMDLSPEEISERFEVTVSIAEETLRYIRTGQVKSVDTVIHENDGDPLTIGDQISSDDDSSGIFVEDFLSQLDDREAEIVKMYMSDLTQAEIGKKLGISQVQVSRLMKGKIKNALEQYMLDKNKEEPEVVKKPIKKQECVEMFKFNKRLPLNGLTIESYKEMLGLGFKTTDIKRYFKLSNSAFYTFKHEHGLVDKEKSKMLSDSKSKTEESPKVDNVRVSKPVVKTPTIDENETKTIAALKQTADKLTEDLNKQEERYNKMVEEMNHHKNESNLTWVELEQQKELAKKYQEELERVTKKLEELEKDYEFLEKKLAVVEAENKDLSEKSKYADKECASMNSANYKLHQQLEEKEKHIMELAAFNSDLQKELSAEKERADKYKLEKENAENLLQAQMNRADQNATSYANLKNEYNKLKEELLLRQQAPVPEVSHKELEALKTLVGIYIQ